ncbi:MAG TPA: ribonuclease HI family protein [Candidatus Manganitrophaceae bacterium]|nr:ribonuclease HI family protein [Candidatus Manganitrophaceae bacterium]
MPAIPSSKKLFIYTDGASRNNPGEAGIGVVIKNERGETIGTIAEYLGIATNNVAEYTAVIRGLETAQKFNPEEVTFYLDSLLVVQQMAGKYKIKHPGLIPLFNKAQLLRRQIPGGKVTFHHIRRELNSEADALANEAIDKKDKRG